MKDESTETVELLFNVMIDGGERIRSSFYPEIVLELTLVKMSTVGKVEKIDDILKRLEKLSPQKFRRGEEPRGSPGREMKGHGAQSGKNGKKNPQREKAVSTLKQQDKGEKRENRQTSRTVSPTGTANLVESSPTKAGSRRLCTHAKSKDGFLAR